MKTNPWDFDGMECFTATVVETGDGKEFRLLGVIPSKTIEPDPAYVTEEGTEFHVWRKGVRAERWVMKKLPNDASFYCGDGGSIALSAGTVLFLEANRVRGGVGKPPRDRLSPSEFEAGDVLVFTGPVILKDL